MYAKSDGMGKGIDVMRTAKKKNPNKRNKIERKFKTQFMQNTTRVRLLDGLCK